MRVAAFQRLAIDDDPAMASDRIVRDVAWADGQDIDLAVFSECCLQGHSYDRAVIERRAMTLEDAPVRSLVDRLAGLKTMAIVGLFERRGTAIFNTALVIEGGRMVGTYAKAHPTEEGCAPGDRFPLWPCGDRRFSINICGDLAYPQTGHRWAEQGATLICCPMNMMLRPKKAARWREPALESLRSRAWRTGCWVVSADAVGANDAGWLSYGCTAVIRPDGTVISQASELVEDVVVAELPPCSGSTADALPENNESATEARDSPRV